MECTQIGAYRVLGDLGSGGMGKVYRAETTRAVAGLKPGSVVALKVIHGHLLETEGFFKRFLLEAQVGQRVDQENVVRCYDCDATLVDGVQSNFLVMEYVEGQTLRDLIAEMGRVPEELCRHIGREVAKGLQAIHEAGVIHRDMKPENVLITKTHVVKVMDLGVAQLKGEAIRLSGVGLFVGSLEYAAPEQFRSAEGEPDGRADLHSLGVVLYELATGRHPYRDEDAHNALRNILDVDARKAGEVNPQLSLFFEEVIHTLLSKDPAARFETAEALALILEEGEQGAWWNQRALALRSETNNPLRRISVPRETALYGREDELCHLEALHEKVRLGEGQVLLIEGEAGVGKTRLVDEFVERVRRDGSEVNFLFASYPPGGAATAAGAFSTAYREHFGSAGLAERLLEYLPTMPLLIPAFAALLQGEADPTGAQALTKDSLQTVFARLTRALASERPTIVLIDDLHFAPEDGRALFSSLAMAVPGHRILLIGTMRPGVPEAWTANITRLDHAGHQQLSRLSPKALSLLLKEAFRSERLARELGFQVSEKSDGNPFFAFEIIRGLGEEAYIKQEADGVWVSTRAIEDIRVPSTVMELIQARLGNLSGEERDLLEVASCCGYEFDPVLVAEAAGVARVPALKCFGQIERVHRLVRSAGRRLRFDHHQVQESLYMGILPALCDEYCAALGEALEACSRAAHGDTRDLDGSLCVELCEHFLKGGKESKVLRYFEPALEHLAVGFLNAQAIALADRVLAVPGLLRGQARLGVLLRKNDRLDLLARREEQRTVLDEAGELTKALGDPALLGEVERANGIFRFSTGDLFRAWEHHQRHLEIARKAGDRKGECAATVNLGNIFYALGSYQEAKEHHRCSIEIAREIKNPRGEAQALGNLGNVLHALGRHEEAREHHEQSIALSNQVGDRQGEAQATGNLGSVFSALGRLEDAEGCYERRLVIARQMGNREGEAIAAVNLGLLWPLLCRADDARHMLNRSLALSREIGARHTEAYALAGQALLAAEQAEEAEAEELALKALALRREIADGGGTVDSLILLGELHWRGGRVAAARDVLEEAEQLCHAQRRLAQRAQALALLAMLPDGDLDAAIAALAEAGESDNTYRVCFFLWKASGDTAHLAEAKRLLDHLIEHAPAKCRSAMAGCLRSYREITDAWAVEDGVS